MTNSKAIPQSSNTFTLNYIGNNELTGFIPREIGSLIKLNFLNLGEFVLFPQNLS